MYKISLSLNKKKDSKIFIGFSLIFMEFLILKKKKLKCQQKSDTKHGSEIFRTRFSVPTSHFSCACSCEILVSWILSRRVNDVSFASRNSSFFSRQPKSLLSNHFFLDDSYALRRKDSTPFPS